MRNNRIITKLMVGGVIAGFIALGCSESSDEHGPSVTPTLQPSPPEAPEPVEPKPKVPKPFFLCVGTDSISRVEIWWVQFTPVTDFYTGNLKPCENSVSDDKPDLEVLYPAGGIKVDVDGEIKTFWMMTKVIDQDGVEHQFFQYSNFYARAYACSKGQFISENNRLIEVRVNEPKSGQGIVFFDDTGISVPLDCRK